MTGGFRWGAPTRVFGGGGRMLGRRDRWWFFWVAATVGAMTTWSSSAAAALAIALGVLVVSGRRRRGLPTWLLPSCLYHFLPSSFLLFLPSPVPPYSLLSYSPLWACFDRVCDLAFTFVRGG